MATPIPDNRARFTEADIVRATGCTLVASREGTFEGVFSDSRAVRPRCVFVALRGASFDGHAFVARAIEAGAGAVVVERGRGDGLAEGAAVVEVEDTLVAWGALARAHIERWRARSAARRVVAITGSAGKTTTKELTAALLGAVAPCHLTAGNLNNRIGVPAVVFGLEDDHRFVVVEMGMSVPGEIAAVASIARPDVAIVTNVGVAHAEGVGGREGVLREKQAVYEALLPDGVAVAWADDAFSLRALEVSRGGSSRTFGRDASATYRLASRTPLGAGGAEVTLARPSGSLAVSLPLPGEAAAIDLAAALAAQEAASGVILGPAVVSAALARVRLPGRAEVRALADGTLVVDDTYNANPSSVRASLASLAEVGPGRRLVAVLGEMKELGALAVAEHEGLGEALAASGVALAIGCGGLASQTLARAAALSPSLEVVAAATTEAAAEAAVVRVQPGDVVLVKGSRSVGAERVVAALVASRGLAEAPETLPAAGKSATQVSE